MAGGQARLWMVATAKAVMVPQATDYLSGTSPLAHVARTKASAGLAQGSSV